MNTTALLALISDLYGQVAQLSEDNQRLRALLGEHQQEAAPGT